MSRAAALLQAPLAALEFLTTLRLRRTPRGSLTHVAQAQGLFPLVGLLLGLILVGLDRAFSKALPPDATDVLLVVTLVLLTGALHVEGLADACDGLFGGRTREERLAIMRDPRIGVYGGLGLTGVLALKWAGLQSLPDDVRVEGLLLAPVLSRWALVTAIAVFPYARPEGMGHEFRAHSWPWSVPVAWVAALAASGLLLGAGGLVLAATMTIAALLVGWYCAAKLGGLTGDTYGAITELVEAVALLALGAAAARGWVDASAWGGLG
ncbi:MAG: adenosylcobinamide-GDP ribazoletransferase [Dehalococcoidia bacterium]